MGGNWYLVIVKGVLPNLMPSDPAMQMAKKRAGVICLDLAAESSSLVYEQSLIDCPTTIH